MIKYSKLIEICAQTYRNLSKDAESVNLKDFEIWVNLKMVRVISNVYHLVSNPLNHQIPRDVSSNV